MPLHDLDLAKNLVAQGEYELVTHKARNDSKNLGWGSRHHAAIFNLLDVDRHYSKSPRKQQSDWGYLDCDQYSIKIVELERDDDYEPSSPDEPPIREARRYEAGIECFVKFAIDTDNPTVAIISLHV